MAMYLQSSLLPAALGLNSHSKSSGENGLTLSYNQLIDNENIEVGDFGSQLQDSLAADLDLSALDTGLVETSSDLENPALLTALADLRAVINERLFKDEVFNDIEGGNSLPVGGKIQPLKEFVADVALMIDKLLTEASDVSSPDTMTTHPVTPLPMVVSLEPRVGMVTSKMSADEAAVLLASGDISSLLSEVELDTPAAQESTLSPVSVERLQFTLAQLSARFDLESPGTADVVHKASRAIHSVLDLLAQQFSDVKANIATPSDNIKEPLVILNQLVNHSMLQTSVSGRLSQGLERNQLDTLAIDKSVAELQLSTNVSAVNKSVIVSTVSDSLVVTGQSQNSLTGEASSASFNSLLASERGADADATLRQSMRSGVAGYSEKSVAASDEQTIFRSQLGQPVMSDRWGAQFGQRISWLVNQGILSADIELNPSELGPLQVRIEQSEQAARVVFVAQHSATREILEAQLPRLKDLFAGQGLTLVDVESHDMGEFSQQHFSQSDSDDPEADLTSIRRPDETAENIYEDMPSSSRVMVARYSLIDEFA